MSDKKSSIPTMELLQAEWDKDSKIKIDELDNEAATIDVLHAKWWEFMVVLRRNLEIRETDLAVLKRDKWFYYSCKMDVKESEARGWPLFSLRLDRAGIQSMIDTDQDILKMNNTLNSLRIRLDFCLDVLKRLNNRSHTINNIIAYQKLRNGMN